VRANAAAQLSGSPIVALKDIRNSGGGETISSLSSGTVFFSGAGNLRIAVPKDGIPLLLRLSGDLLGKLDQ
jgi:hypothetical protein